VGVEEMNEFRMNRMEKDIVETKEVVKGISKEQ